MVCSACNAAVKPSLEKPVVRVAVIGGMTMTGMWQEVSKMFEAKTGYKVQVVATGPRPICAKALREGKVDLLTMHSGDITTDLVADGYAINMRPWTHNDLVIVGPANDPAKVRGLHDGVEAFRQIASAKANFVDFQGVGSREMCNTLWKKAEIRPQGDWYLKDESVTPERILEFAASKNAYVVVGRMPVLFEKMKSGGLEILVDSDPLMRRPYVVMEADPKRFPHTNVAGAKALSDFLVSDTVQSYLAKAASNQRKNVPLFHPMGRPTAK
jgi:tungstate transport system substrate-binding protein